MRRGPLVNDHNSISLLVLGSGIIHIIHPAANRGRANVQSKGDVGGGPLAGPEGRGARGVQECHGERPQKDEAVQADLVEGVDDECVLQVLWLDGCGAPHRQ